MSIQARITGLLRRLCKGHGTAVMLVTRDMGVIAQTADRITVMYLGRIVEEAETEVLFADPKHPYARMLLDTIPNVNAPQRGCGGRGAEPARAATRLPVPHPLPDRRRPLQGGSPELVQKADSARVACHFA